MSTVDALQSCMQQEDTLITEFSTVLEEETEVLVGLGTVGVLQEITERKGGLARKLVDLSQVRDSLLAEIGLPAGHTGTEQAAVLHPQLSGVWQSLLSKSRPPTKSTCATAPSSTFTCAIRSNRWTPCAMWVRLAELRPRTMHAAAAPVHPWPQAYRCRLNCGTGRISAD